MCDDGGVRSALIRRLLLAGLVAVASLWPATAGAQDSDVLVARVEGPITPVVASHLSEGVERAEREGHAAFLVEMDTPGGLDTSMREIIKSFLGARVPVVVYVAPRGARATSAGAIIGLSAHVLAMAPGTNIGAATPVNLSGEGAEEVGDKIVNDAAAYAEAVARERGRDETFARESVTEGRSEPAEEAEEIGVADLLAADRGALLEELDGTAVELPGDRRVELATADAGTVSHEMGFFRSVRQRLADPNITFLFMSLGSLALIYELANPGIQVAGIAGVILIVLGLFSLAVLPVNVAGVLFLLLAVGLFVAEIFAPGIGVFAAGGGASLVLAAIFLFRGSVGVDLWVALPSAVVVVGAVLLAGRLVVRAQRGSSATGEGSLVGRTGTLREAEGRTGRVVIDGTWWSVESPGAALESGQDVRVTEMRGIKLIVEPQPEEPAPEEPGPEEPQPEEPRTEEEDA